jgi:hypothetical protein
MPTRGSSSGGEGGAGPSHHSSSGEDPQDDATVATDPIDHAGRGNNGISGIIPAGSSPQSWRQRPSFPVRKTFLSDADDLK